MEQKHVYIEANMRKECIYLLVIDYADRSGNSGQTIEAYAKKEAAKRAYDNCVKETKKGDYPAYFDSDGNFKEDEYGDIFTCNELIGKPKGELFSFYETGCYKTEHYTVYWKEQEIIA